MKLLLPGLLLLSACTVMTPAELRSRDIARHVALVVSPENADGDRDGGLAIYGDDAILPLVKILRESPDPGRRAASARALGRLYRNGAHPLALSAYVEVLTGGASASLVRDLLRVAQDFDDPDGSVRLLLLAFIANMPTATAEMVANAATLSGDDALEAMKAYVFRTRALADDRGRDIAIRAIGRTARHGRRDAVEFLVNCTMTGNEMLTLTASRELDLTCGLNTERNWRGWWLENAKLGRFDWLVASTWRDRGRTFDPGSAADWSELIGQADASGELEPLFAMVAGGLGLRFGYVSTRDCFDPSVSEEVVREHGRDALDLLRAWWRDNGMYCAPGDGGSLVFEADRRLHEMPRDWTAESDALVAQGDYAGAIVEVAKVAKARDLPMRLLLETEQQRSKIIEAGRGYFHEQQARLAVVRETQPELAKQICKELLLRLGEGKVAEFSEEVRKARAEGGN